MSEPQGHIQDLNDIENGVVEVRGEGKNQYLLRKRQPHAWEPARYDEVPHAMPSFGGHE